MSGTEVDRMLAAAAYGSPTTISDQKKLAVAAAADAKKSTLGGLPSLSPEQMYASVVGAATGKGAASATPEEQAVRTMDGIDLLRTYGDNANTAGLIKQRSAARQNYAQDATVTRDWDQTAADTVSGVGLVRSMDWRALVRWLPVW